MKTTTLMKKVLRFCHWSNEAKELSFNNVEMLIPNVISGGIVNYNDVTIKIVGKNWCAYPVISTQSNVALGAMV